MAHGDYHCCALCDSKMDYSNDARTKEDLCSYCNRKLVESGVIVFDGNELTQWMSKEWHEGRGKEAKSKLSDLGFSECFYDNEVDRTFKTLDGDPL